MEVTVVGAVSEVGDGAHAAVEQGCVLGGAVEREGLDVVVDVAAGFGSYAIHGSTLEQVYTEEC